MKGGLEIREEEARVTQEWQPHAGVHVVFYAQPGSNAIKYAPEELRNAEGVAEVLRKLLTPEEARMGKPVDIYLTDAPNLTPEDILRSVPPVSAGDAGQEKPGCASPILCRVPAQSRLEPLAVSLTRCLLHRWFGEHAVAVAAFVEGIAGVAAAQSGVGPTIEEADQWVRAELEAGRTVSVTAQKREKREKKKGLETATPRDYNAAATSFVAFLVANSGPAVLRHYLSIYDPDRQDQAAIEAYHHPLAVLEEEWLSRLQHHANTGDALRTFLRQILPLLKPYGWKQIEIFVYLLLAAGYNIVQPYAIKTVIDRLTAVTHISLGAAAGQLFLKILAPFLLLLLGIYVLNGLVSLRRAYTVNWLNQNVLNTLQIRMYSHLQRLAHNFYLKAKIGDLMARLNDDLDNVQSALAQVTNKALYQSFTAIGAVTALCMLTRKSPTLAIPILCIIPLFAINYAALRKRNKQASREQRRRIGQAMADVQQHLSAHALIKAFRLEEQTISDYRSRVQALQKSKLRLALLSAMTDLSEDMTTALAQLIIFGVGGYLVLRDGNKGLGVGDISALLVLVKSIFSPIASLAGIGQTLQQATGAMERVSELFNEPITVCDKPDAVALPPLTHAIQLENVVFRYGGDRPALRDLSLTIPAGAHVAIVGLSGSGKSSTVNLLLRFWDPEEGRVLFDGHDLRDVTLASLRDQIGLVFQET